MGIDTILTCSQKVLECKAPEEGTLTTRKQEALHMTAGLPSITTLAERLHRRSLDMLNRQLTELGYLDSEEIDPVRVYRSRARQK